ncbi:hypothetical protein ACWEOI_29630 [Nocardia sp. NPDC004340]|uniref:hypothetical protein n=1 Tax=Nocardia sp. CA-136227 TaxID=3239979 RepID=UPI003D99946A
MHHIVATQFNPDGSVLSTLSQDVDVTELACHIGAGSVQSSTAIDSLVCNLTSGS